jgi:SAM-dependent methyltransferase
MISARSVKLDTDYISVTEIAGDEVSQEQVDRLCNRYYWAERYCLDKDVVEVACGTGQGLGYLFDISLSLEAGDYSNAILSIARKHYGNRIALRQFDAQDMPFPDKSKDVIILFEAIYYLPDAEQFVRECSRVLRPQGKVLIATANKDLYDFNSSPYLFKYYGVVDLKSLFSKYGFKTEFFGATPVDIVSMRQKILRPVKKLAVNFGLMPKTTSGKKWLKRIVFGSLVRMPAEIGPPITRICADSGVNQKSPPILQISPNKKNEGYEGSLYRGRCVEPARISGSKADRAHKVIYCVATLE